MKTEKEKMLSNELYNHKDAELTKERNHAYELTLRYNQTKDDETELRTSILQQLAGKLGNNVVIKPPFQCDYGYNLILGDNVFMNYGCSILDCNVVEIGNNVLMAPNVQIYAAYHPTDHTLRLKDLEYADRVKIGDNTWIGGGSIILNGVTIGKNTVIGAGSVVTKDIPENVVAVGNPCRVIKRLDKENVENGKRLKFTDFAHINIVVDDIDEGIKYYEQLLEAKPIQIFREFSNIGFAKAAGFLEHPELVKLSIAFMEIPGTKLTLELGREDTQVKVRGHRIELGEAENVLLTHELIKSAVVVVEEDKSGLAAAVVLNEDSDCCDNKNVEKILHEYLGKKLPEYMVPGKILVMEQLPLSVNGKVDRKALRKILGGYQGQISEEKKKEAPQGELEVKIAAIWERVLGTKEISRDDDFFMCGGDSLKAVKIISELNATEGLPNDLAIQTLFALPTVALLAEQIEKLVSLLDVEENTEYEEGVL